MCRDEVEEAKYVGVGSIESGFDEGAEGELSGGDGVCLLTEAGPYGVEEAG